MKVLFVTNVMDEFMDFAPLGIMYLSAALKSRGHATKIVNTNLKNIYRTCRDFKPQIIGYGLTTGFQNDFLNINKYVKENFAERIFSIFGGPHTTYFPEFIREEGVDAIFLGESEWALLDFVERFKDNQDIYSVKNMWIKDAEDRKLVHRNSPRGLIDNLDSLPFPDRDIVDVYLGRPLRFHTFMASRGCPYDCSYCFNASFRKLYQGNGQTVRRRSVDNLIEELLMVKRGFPLEHVSFQDDEFCGSSSWLEEFAGKYKRNIAVSFSCNFRPNLVSMDKIKILKQAGLNSVTMAFETGNEYLRNNILKRNLSKDAMLKAADMIRSQGVFLTIQNMVGIPGGSLEADFETLRLNIAAQPDYAWVSICSPYPGTELGEYAKGRGYFDGDLAKIKPTYHFHSPLKIEHKREVENLHKLFAVSVEYAHFMKVVKLLIKLPLGRLYNVLRKFFKGRVYYKKNRFGIKFSIKDKMKYGIKFLKEIGG